MTFNIGNKSLQKTATFSDLADRLGCVEVNVYRNGNVTFAAVRT